MITKSKTVGYFLAFFFGGLGIHAFYYKRYVRGILYLIFSWTYIPLFLGWIDMFFINKWHEHLFNRESESTNKIKNKAINEERQVINKEFKFVEEAISQMSTHKNSLLFYTEENVILPEYKHIQTPKAILESINKIKNSNDTYYQNGISFEVIFSDSDISFVKDSLRFANEKGQECLKIPLHAYWTTFEKLNMNQRKWYFYWRKQVLNGKYPDVDLSYIILFIYELMNYSFNQNAAFNISMMVRLHEEYKERVPKLTNYSERWIADMLYEVKELELAKVWDPEKKQVPPLYQQILAKEQNLTRISITSWRPYVKVYRETKFFTDNKNKIYKVFKNSIPLLKQVYEKKGIQLIERWFLSEEEREIRHLFVSAVMGRSYDEVHVFRERIKPTEDLFNDVTTLFKISENVTRLMNGEKREIKVEEAYLPEGFKDMMIELFSKNTKEVNKRFKMVQKSEMVEHGGEIPSPQIEEKKNIPNKSKIEFDNEKISKLQSDIEDLIQIINERSEVEQEIDNESFNEITLIDEKVMEENTNLERIELHQYPIFSSLNVTNDEDEEEFVKVLSDIEKEFLLQLEGGQLSQEEANRFVKKRGIMLGMFLSELNEKANEFLGDNLLENQVDTIVILEEYEKVLLMIKEYEG